MHPFFDPWICESCGELGAPKTVFKGHFMIELVLWLVFIPIFCFPGIIYTFWRRSTKQKACPACNRIGTMIPSSTPRGRELEAAWSKK